MRIVIEECGTFISLELDLLSFTFFNCAQFMLIG